MTPKIYPAQSVSPPDPPQPPPLPARSGCCLSPSSVRTRRYSTPQLPRSTYGSSGDAYPSQMTSVLPSLSVGGREAVHDHWMSSAE
jgi:hypothetical protein